MLYKFSSANSPDYSHPLYKTPYNSRLIFLTGLLICSWAAFPQQLSNPVPQVPTNAVIPTNFSQMRPPEGTRIFRDIPYVTNGHPRQKLDLYLPPNGTNLPLVVWIHGGAWLAGSKEMCRALPLLNGGFAIASINYRLSQHAIFPAQLQDCKAAIRWLRAHAHEYGIDPDRIGVWGESAGGHLAALVGTTGDITEFDVGENLHVSSAVQAVCDWFGPTDFTTMNNSPELLSRNPENLPEARLIGGPVHENKDRARRANPITYVTKDDPPFLIMHGDNDNVVPINQSELLVEALKQTGVKVKYHVVKGGGHGFGAPQQLNMVRQFFIEHLRPSDRPIDGTQSKTP